MRWNKESIIIVGLIFLVSYYVSSRSESDKSLEVKKQTLASCKVHHASYCDMMGIYHNKCFQKSYRSKYRIKTFFKDDYIACLQKETAVP